MSELVNTYDSPELFFRTQNRLLDTINVQFPEIENIYIQQRAKDWAETDVPLSSCKLDFMNCDPKIKELMISVLAYQWETDTVVSRSIIGIIEKFNPADVLMTAWTRIQDNEKIHARTYSEIIKFSFDNPNEVLLKIEQIKFAQKRLKVTSDVFDKTYEVSNKLGLGLLNFKDEIVVDTLIQFLVALYCTERIQFIASFSVSFTITRTGLFQPIQDLLQKICADEFEIHQRLDALVLSILKRDPKYKEAFIRNKNVIKQIVEEVIESEKQFLEVAFSTGVELPGVEKDDFFQFVLFQARAVFDLLEIEHDFIIPKKIPISHMKDFINIDRMQSAVQEKKPTNYLMGNIIHDHVDKDLDGFSLNDFS